MVALAAVALPLAPAEPGANAVAPRCPDVRHVDLVGLACLDESGLYATFGPDGTFAGYTHGVDHAGDRGSDVEASASSIAPACVISPTASVYYTKIFYVRPTDVANSYSTKKSTIVSTVSSANGWLHDAAVATGGAADVKVECETGGAVRVFNQVLSTTRAATTFATISTDLKNAGYTEINAKHWVFVDGGASNICSCGVGNLYDDDSLSASNANNGISGTIPEFAVNFDMASHTIAIHELSHNMGAVQHSAPHSTWLPPSDDGNAWHCNDGLDIMCYNDGGHNTGGRCSSTNWDCAGVCTTEVYDCGKDDYFHRAPLSGNYLATHWNLGNPLNRFLNFDPCAGRPVVLFQNSGLSGACATFDADEDDLTGVTFTNGANANDGASGAVVFSGRILTLYKDVSYAGASLDVVGSVSLFPSGWNDAASSLRVRDVGAACAPDAWVTVYQHASSGGGCRAWNNGLLDSRTATATRVDEPNLANHLYNNAVNVDNSISSLRVRYPFKITLYAVQNVAGASTSYTEGTYDSIGSWNDVASSATIQCVFADVPLSVCDQIGDAWARATGRP